MIATLQKIVAAGIDKDDQVQFRVDKEHVDENILIIRRGDLCRVKLEGIQGTLVDKTTGEVTTTNDWVEFETDSISIALAVLQDGMIATITCTVGDKLVIERILNSGLRGQQIELVFKDPEA